MRGIIALERAEQPRPLGIPTVESTADIGVTNGEQNPNRSVGGVMSELIEVPPGLAGVAVAATEISDVLGPEGYYHYRGQPAPKLARESNYETVAALVLDGSTVPLSGDRALPPSLEPLLQRTDLRTALSALGVALELGALTEISREQRVAGAVRLITAMPTLVASVLHGRMIEPDPSLGHVADFIRMVTGSPASAEVVAALESYFVLTIDHGFSNSTFAARVVASSGADLASCVLAGFGALNGPRHGAYPERILDMLDGIKEHGNAVEWMKIEVAAGRRLQGFGHSVYQTQDPRLELLREVGAVVAPDRSRAACEVEVAGAEVLSGRRLAPNLDLHAAVVLEGCAMPRGWFTAAFATARIAGWCAHAIEEASNSKILRPAAYYVGPTPTDNIY
jgi:citrate synthase